MTTIFTDASVAITQITNPGAYILKNGADVELSWATIIGLTAAACTTWAFLPQVIKIFKTKDTRGISLLMYIIFTTGIALWLIYGLIIMDLPLIAANFITFLLSFSVLLLKFKHG